MSIPYDLRWRLEEALDARRPEEVAERDWRHSQQFDATIELASRWLGELTKGQGPEVALHWAELTLSGLQEALDWTGVPSSTRRSDFFRFVDAPIARIKNRTWPRPEINRWALERFCQNYFDRDYRSSTAERAMVGLLIESELVAYVQAVVQPDRWTRWLQPTPINSWMPLFAYPRDRIASALIWGVLSAPAWIAMLLGSKGAWIAWVLGLAGALWVLEALWALAWLPLRSIRWAKARASIRNLLQKMTITYAAMSGDGAISPEHVHELASAAAADGVIWPSTLFVILERLKASGQHI